MYNIYNNTSVTGGNNDSNNNQVKACHFNNQSHVAAGSLGNVAAHVIDNQYYDMDLLMDSAGLNKTPNLAFFTHISKSFEENNSYAKSSQQDHKKTATNQSLHKNKGEQFLDDFFYLVINLLFSGERIYIIKKTG